MATQQDAVDALNASNQLLVKIGNETKMLVSEVKRLEDALAAAGGAGGTITAELEDAVKATVQHTQNIDALVEDSPASGAKP